MDRPRFLDSCIHPLALLILAVALSGCTLFRDLHQENPGGLPTLKQILVTEALEAPQTSPVVVSLAPEHRWRTGAQAGLGGDVVTGRLDPSKMPPERLGIKECGPHGTLCEHLSGAPPHGGGPLDAADWYWSTRNLGGVRPSSILGPERDLLLFDLTYLLCRGMPCYQWLRDQHVAAMGGRVQLKPEQEAMAGSVLHVVVTGCGSVCDAGWILRRAGGAVVRENLRGVSGLLKVSIPRDAQLGDRALYIWARPRENPRLVGSLELEVHAATAAPEPPVTPRPPVEPPPDPAPCDLVRRLVTILECGVSP